MYVEPGLRRTQGKKAPVIQFKWDEIALGATIILFVFVLVTFDSAPVEAYSKTITHDNAYYCDQWRATHEPVVGASDTQMDKLCKSINH